MSWVPIDFAPAGRHCAAARISVVKKDRTLGVAVTIAKAAMETLGWTPDIWVVPEIGIEGDEGWLLLSPGQEGGERARKLRQIRGSIAARLLMPVFPWMENPQLVPVEDIDAKIAKGTLRVKLPPWARVPQPEPAPPPTRAEAVAAAKERFGVK